MSSKNKLLFIGISFILLIFTSLLLFIIPKVEIKINNDASMIINIGEEYTEYGAIAKLIGIGKKENIPVEINGKVDTSSPGKYVITYHVKYKNSVNMEVKHGTVEHLHLYRTPGKQTPVARR